MLHDQLHLNSCFVSDMLRVAFNHKIMCLQVTPQGYYFKGQLNSVINIFIGFGTYVSDVE